MIGWESEAGAGGESWRSFMVVGRRWGATDGRTQALPSRLSGIFHLSTSFGYQTKMRPARLACEDFLDQDGVLDVRTTRNTQEVRTK